MPQTTQKFLSDIQSDNADVRFAAWRQAGEVDAETIPQLGKLAASENPGVAKAAREALTTIAHSVGKEISAPKRAGVVKRLVEVGGAGYSIPVRALAYRLLSQVAGDDVVPAIAKSIHDTDLREEVVYCLERIPGSASLKALQAAYRDAKDDFKPRILAALGHRRAEEAVGLYLEAMRSPNKDIAVAAMKAFGRIGRKPSAAPRFPDAAGLSDWQKIEHMDSLLRYADAQVSQGNHAEAMKFYRIAFDRPEEHWQCAAIIGIAKMGTPEAATVIFPKLSSGNRTVRITAENAWKGIARAASSRA